MIGLTSTPGFASELSTQVDEKATVNCKQIATTVEEGKSLAFLELV
jgi:hypothetical protein